MSFNASGSGGGIAQYVWQFNTGPGGGQVQTVKTTSATISHTFPTAANYRVALTTMAGNGRSRGTAKTVDVKPPVIGSATIQAGQTVRSIIANGFKISSHLSEAGTEKGVLQITAAKATQLGIPRTIGTGTLAFTAAATKTMTMNLHCHREEQAQEPEQPRGDGDAERHRQGRQPRDAGLEERDAAALKFGPVTRRPARN